jgi:hypothetical protein
LRARGLEVYSLAGGMQAWSLAWNAAELRAPNSPARIIQVRRTGKGCLSYLIGADGQAAVIDAALEPAVYQLLAEQHGWRRRRRSLVCAPTGRSSRCWFWSTPLSAGWSAWSARSFRAELFDGAVLAWSL